MKNRATKGDASRGQQPEGGSGEGGAPNETLRLGKIEECFRQEQREQGKRRQGVVRQFGFHERENDEDDRRAADEITVEQITIAPELPGQPGQAETPREKGEENGHEVERQHPEVSPNRMRAVALHDVEGAGDDVPPDADAQKFSVCAHERGNAPERDDGKGEGDAGERRESGGSASHRESVLSQRRRGAASSRSALWRERRRRGRDRISTTNVAAAERRSGSRAAPAAVGRAAIRYPAQYAAVMKKTSHMSATAAFACT